MNHFVKKSQAITYIIIGIAILLILGVWPFGVIHRTYKTASSSDTIVESAEATENHMHAQVFASEGNELDWIDIYVSNNVAGQKLDFAIFDGEFIRLSLVQSRCFRY